MTNHDPSISHLSKTNQASMASMVVPVYVSHQDAPNKEVLVYALLDTQSDTTFIQEDIQEELGIEGQACYFVPIYDVNKGPNGS